MPDELKKSLSQAITQGKNYRWQGSRGKPESLIYFGPKFGPNVLYCGDSTPSRADAELIAEAFNVTHETGKTPRELLVRVLELETALQDLIYKVFPQPKTKFK